MLAAILTNLAVPDDTHDGWLPQEVIDTYRKAKSKEYTQREEFVADMRSMLEDVVTSNMPELADEARQIERTLISRRGTTRKGVTTIIPFVDYAAILRDIDAMQRVMDLYIEYRRREDEAILVLLLDE